MREKKAHISSPKVVDGAGPCNTSNKSNTDNTSNTRNMSEPRNAARNALN